LSDLRRDFLPVYLYRQNRKKSKEKNTSLYKLLNKFYNKLFSTKLNRQKWNLSCVKIKTFLAQVVSENNMSVKGQQL